MNRIYLLIITLVLCLPLCAQLVQPAAAKRNNCDCGFQGIVQGGLLEGAIGPSWNLQTINGAYYKTWFAGIGVGLDHYTMRTIPLFVDVRKDLLKRKRTPFLYADAGIQFDWLRTKDKPRWGGGEYKPGVYYDAGLGYKFGLGKRDAILISAGYTMKSLKEERMVVQQCIQAPCNTTKEYYKYTYSRLSFKIGWQFN